MGGRSKTKKRKARKEGDPQDGVPDAHKEKKSGVRPGELPGVLPESWDQTLRIHVHAPVCSQVCIFL